VVQAFFTIGIILATCTTQCLLFIPKVTFVLKFDIKEVAHFNLNFDLEFRQATIILGIYLSLLESSQKT